MISLTFAGLIVGAGTLSLASVNIFAADTQMQTIATLFKNKESFVGKQIHAQGEVVKVNNKIMGRNFVHIQDGTGDAKAGTNDLVLTSKQTAKIGDKIGIAGIVGINRDFGYGYTYPLLIEEASITLK